MIRALYNCISNIETWLIQYYSCFSPKTKVPVYLCYIWPHHDALKVVLLSELEHIITQHVWNFIYFLRYLTCMLPSTTRISRLDYYFLLMGLVTKSVCDYCLYFEWTMKTGRLWCGRRRRQSEVLSAFGFYLMHSAKCLAIEVVFSPFLVPSRLIKENETYILFLLSKIYF